MRRDVRPKGFEMHTYIEHVNRYVVEYSPRLTDQEKAVFRINNLDPDNDNWLLKWSFKNLEEAEEMAREEQEAHDEFCMKYPCDRFHTFRFRDLGADQKISRSSFF